MNVYNLFISKSVLLKPVDHLEHSPLPFPSLNQHFFLFLSTKSCDILCIFKQLIRALLCFYSRDNEYLSSSTLPSFSLLLFEKELLPKETFFFRNYGKRYSACDTHTYLPCLSYNYKKTQNEEVELTSEVDILQENVFFLLTF